MKKRNDDVLRFSVIKTDVCCYISDCEATHGYDYIYHNSDLKNKLFDGVKAEPTYNKNWYKIKCIPKKIQVSERKNSNARYELSNEKLLSESMPKVIMSNDYEKYDEDVLDCYYTYKYDSKNVLRNVKFEHKIVMEVVNFQEPVELNYKAIRKDGWDEKKFDIVNADLDHQLLDKVIFPDVMLHTRPCKISSQKLYQLTRQHVIDNISHDVASITSNYDFCFTVEKKIPLIEPEKVSYNNIFARTKKERKKTHYKTVKFKSVDIFEMTHSQSNYNGYTVLSGISAENQNELKEKIDEWLEELMLGINKPLGLCNHCNGTGYVETVDKIKQHQGG